MNRFSLIFPDKKIEFLVKFCHNGTTCVNRVDSDGLIDLNKFQSFDLANIFPLASLVRSPENPENFQEFWVSSHELYNSGQILTANSLIFLDYIFLLKPESSFLGFSLVIVPLKQLFGDTLENYISFIGNFTVSYQEILGVYRENLRKKREITSEQAIRDNEYHKTTESCDIVIGQLKEKKQAICELALVHEEIRKKFEFSECENCNSNTRNILFLPCGHLIICNECLQRNYEIVPNLPITNSKKNCSKCNSVINQALNCSNSF